MPLCNKSEEVILEALKQFYKDWLVWVNEGAQPVQPFSRHEGLCISIQCWAWMHGLRDLTYDMKSYMKDDFRNEGLDTLYPFGEADWNERGTNNTMHQCPKRIAWVKRHAVCYLP